MKVKKKKKEDNSEKIFSEFTKKFVSIFKEYFTILITALYIFICINSAIYNHIVFNFFDINYFGFATITDFFLSIFNFTLTEMLFLLFASVSAMITAYILLFYMSQLERDYRITLTGFIIFFGLIPVSLYMLGVSLDIKTNKFIKDESINKIEYIDFKNNDLDDLVNVQLIGTSSNYFFIYNPKTKKSKCILKSEVTSITYDFNSGNNFWFYRYFNWIRKSDD